MKLNIFYPENQSDILLKDYLEYEKIMEELKDKDELIIIFETIKIFYHLKNDDIKNISYKEIKNLYNNINNILGQSQELILTFKIDGIKFGFVPNMDDISFAEFVDLDTNDYIRKLCILYRPIIKEKNGKYQVASYKADLSYYDLFKNNLPFSILKGFIGFFLNIQKDLLNFTLKSLQTEVLDPQMKKNLEENGDGFLGYMNSLVETLQKQKI